MKDQNDPRTTEEAHRDTRASRGDPGRWLVMLVILLLALLALVDGVALWFWLRCCALP